MAFAVEDVLTFECVCVCALQTKLSRLCEQDKAVRMQEEKLQQLHREKVQQMMVFFFYLLSWVPMLEIEIHVRVVWQHTLETALLSASQELSEQSGSNAAAVQSLVQQKDVLQNGLLSTCRELSRVSAVSIPTHSRIAMEAGGGSPSEDRLPRLAGSSFFPEVFVKMLTRLTPNKETSPASSLKTSLFFPVTEWVGTFLQLQVFFLPLSF